MHEWRAAHTIRGVSILQLPRTSGCLVCGRDNALGLRLRLFVDDQSGVVTARYTPEPRHIGFTDIVHGGVIATVADEAMVWAATWAGRRFCVCAEMTVRFRKSAAPNEPLTFEAKVETFRSRLIVASYRCLNEQGEELSLGSGKYTPVSIDDHAKVVTTCLDEPEAHAAVAYLSAEK